MLMHWLTRQGEAALDGFRQWRRTPLATLMTCLVIGITLALPAILRIAIDNVTVLSDRLKETASLTLFLEQEAGQAEVQKTVSALHHRRDVLALQTISPAAGLQQVAQQTGLHAPASDLPGNPLPWVIVVTPVSSDNPAKTLFRLKAFIEHLPNIESVQLDTEWLTQLSAILKTVHRIALSLSVLLCLAVLFITGNTIWTVIRRHGREIHIIRLTGGTAGFIRRPFLYAGALYGFGGACIATGLVTLLVHYLTDPIHQLALLYKSPFTLTGLSPVDTLSLLGTGILLGLAGAWLAVTRYLYSEAALASTERKMLE